MSSAPQLVSSHIGMADTAWRVYYDDGSTYTGDPEDAPALGVIAIVEADSTTGRRIMSRADFYAWHGDYWDNHDIFGLWDYLSAPGWKRVLFGRSVSDEVFHAVHRQAEADPDFPKRSGRHPDEPAVA